jgi:N-ethylmaleimide reductase
MAPLTRGRASREHVPTDLMTEYYARKVTDAVHEAGGHIFAQLWHMGRLVHPSLHGVQPVSASATIAPG